MADGYQEVYRQEDWNTEEYAYISENGFKHVAEEPLSTFPWMWIRLPMGISAG